VKLSATILDSIEQDNEGSSSKDNYLSYTKLEQGKPANFALLEQDPLEYWLVWADPKDGGNGQPFRFVDNQPMMRLI